MAFSSMYEEMLLIVVVMSGSNYMLPALISCLFPALRRTGDGEGEDVGVGVRQHIG